MTADVRIDVLPDVAVIPTVRLMLRRALPQLGSDDDSLYFGAVTEILANAMQAHAERIDEPIQVELSLLSRPEVAISDHGDGFDPDDVPSTARADGRGNGLVIARSACPDMTIDSSPAGTTVRLPFGPGPIR